MSNLSDKLFKEYKEKVELKTDLLEKTKAFLEYEIEMCERQMYGLRKRKEAHEYVLLALTDWQNKEIVDKLENSL